jgi:hypothetical protein
MTHSELQAEQLVVLPLRLETVTVAGGDAAQQSGISQFNFNNMIGGDCIESNCSQSSFQFNNAYVNQDLDYELEVENVIEDSRHLAQAFILGPAGGR